VGERGGRGLSAAAVAAECTQQPKAANRPRPIGHARPYPRPRRPNPAPPHLPYRSYASTSFSTPSSTLALPGAMPSMTWRLPCVGAGGAGEGARTVSRGGQLAGPFHPCPVLPGALAHCPHLHSQPRHPHLQPSTPDLHPTPTPTPTRPP
jgi:hypothetical protein